MLTFNVNIKIQDNADTLHEHDQSLTWPHVFCSANEKTMIAMRIATKDITLGMV